MRKPLEMKDDLFRGEFGASGIDVKELTDDGTFEGYASIFGEIDQGMDSIQPGAFLGSLVSFPPAKVKMLWQHQRSEVIGKYLEIREDGNGLYCKGKLNMDVQRGREAHALMREGSIDGLSIGYRSLEDRMDRNSGVRTLIKIELREISIVTFPMQETAQVRRVKSGEIPTERDLEDMLKRDAGLSSKKAKAFIAGGYRAMLGARDAADSDQDSALDALATLARMMRA